MVHKQSEKTSKESTKTKKSTVNKNSTVANEVKKVALAENKRLDEISKKRDSLIKEIKSNLMPNSALRSGGPENRSRYAQEQANYAPVIQEINELGTQLKIRPIGLGNMRS